MGAHLPIAVGAAWSAQYRTSGQVAALALGNGVLYAGGSFSSAGGASRSELAAFDAA